MEVGPDAVNAVLRVEDALITQEEVMKDLFRSIGILIGVISTVIGGAVAAQAPDGFIEIVNSGSGLCLQRNGDGLGEPIVPQHCDGSPAQRWIASPATDTHSLIASPLPDNLCLDVRDGVDADRTVVQQWNCNLQVASMRWQFSTLVPDRFFKLTSDTGSRCLDVAGGSLEPGAQIQIFRCTQDNTNTAQIWETRTITVLDLTGSWTDGSTRRAVLSTRFPSLTIDMSAYGRPAARGSIVDSSTITVTFPDDATYTGKLQPPSTIRWSNGSAWTKV
jgi:Ricin-type beta-trefoil lectin domain